MLQAVVDTSKWTTGKIAAIRALAEHTTEHVRTRLPKIYTRELVDVIFEQPYRRIGNVVDKGIAQRQAASRLVSYRGSHELVKVICPVHGAFDVAPGHHKNGSSSFRVEVAKLGETV